ncbi:hypothetical protein NX794_07690 [Streptomyces sp. LP11]|uniref:Uncharacterized protein n=1 Tax=Streptomyces pyxinicus TaxID=2970331 RepID=A0ABT2AXX4_9ACTN|nr:hypothetical protein [Streptomyces sp. LP11]MCS0601112.1 hypothetical protein [Streptomyces sp. LP11]
MDGLTVELAKVQRLGILMGDSDGGHLAREFLVRRAAAVDRVADMAEGHPSQVAATLTDAIDFARELISHDFINGTTRGPLPVDAPCWTDNERGYARQEHRAWIIEHEV